MKHQACKKCVQSLGWINVGGNSFVAMVKVYLGLIGGSTALFADGIHSFGDVGGSITMLIGLKVAERPTNRKFPYGYGKFEYIAATVIYTLLFFVGIYIFVKAMHLILYGHMVNPDMVTVIGALISLVANELMYRQSICAGNQLHSPSMIANAHEKRADVWSSGAVLLGIIGAKLGFHILDPLAAMMVSFFIFKLCFSMLKESLKGLMDASLSKKDRLIIQEELYKYPDLKMKTLRTREIGQKISIEIDATLSAPVTLKDLDEMKNKIKEGIMSRIGRPGEVGLYFETSN